MSVSGVSICAASGKSVFSVWRIANSCRVKAATVDFRQALPRHDVVREADRLDFLLGPGGRAAVAAGGYLGRLVNRMVLCDRPGRIDREEGRNPAIARRGRDRVRGDLAVDRSGGEIGVGLLVADGFGGFIGRKLHDLDLARIDAVLLQDHLEQIDIGLGAADHADAVSGELDDLGDRWAPPSCLWPLSPAAPTAPRRSCAGRHRLGILRHVDVAAHHGEIDLALGQRLGARCARRRSASGANGSGCGG